MKVKTDAICVVFLLVFGATFVFLGLINWLGLSGSYAGGLILLLMSLSYTKYKAYAKYIVPTLLIIGATTAILGWYLIPTLQQIPPPANPYVSPRILVVATGMGVFCGGIVNFVVRRGEMANQKLTVKKVLAIVILTALGSTAIGLLYFGIFLFSLPFTANATVSWILSIFITVGIPIVLFAASEMKKKKRSDVK